MNWLLYEQSAREKGYVSIAGVDEAGRGPLAGPVFAAAVIFPENVEIDGINDSKKLSEKKRELLFDEIIQKAAAYHIASVDHIEIDRINILNATMKAMSAAVEGLGITPDYVLIDGNKAPESGIKTETVIKGDAKSLSIAAASILAKVSRDRMIDGLDCVYPEYGFKKHKGYGTRLHMDMIKEFGPCPIHRMTFLRKILSE